jgi:hypothetical protein
MRKENMNAYIVRTTLSGKTIKEIHEAGEGWRKFLIRDQSNIKKFHHINYINIYLLALDELDAYRIITNHLKEQHSNGKD